MESGLLSGHGPRLGCEGMWPAAAGLGQTIVGANVHAKTLYFTQKLSTSRTFHTISHNFTRLILIRHLGEDRFKSLAVMIASAKEILATRWLGDSRIRRGSLAIFTSEWFVSLAGRCGLIEFPFMILGLNREQNKVDTLFWGPGFVGDRAPVFCGRLCKCRQEKLMCARNRSRVQTRVYGPKWAFWQCFTVTRTIGSVRTQA